MAKLIVNPTSSSKREIPLPRTLLSIGRDPSNDVVLPDAMVSRRHAVIEYRGTQYFIRDCNSSNGSLVNGDRVSERSLRDGDLVAIGTARILFREEMEGEESGASKVVQHPSSRRLLCPSCQGDIRKGDLFCRQCGASVIPSAPPKAVCTSCGTAVPLPARFCNACGTPLEGGGKEFGLELTKPRPIEEIVVEEVAGGGPDSGPATERPQKSLESPPGDVHPPGSPPAVPPRAPEVPRALALDKGGSSAALPAFSLPPPAPAPPPPVPVPRPGPVLAPPPLPRVVSAKPTRVDPVPAEAMRPEVPAAAGFGPRLLAALVDGCIVGAVQAVILSPVGWYWSGRLGGTAETHVPFIAILLSLSAVALATIAGLGYHVYFWGLQGATPGKRLLRLTVVAEDGSQPIGLYAAAIRALGYLLSGALFGIGFLMVAFGGVGLHDRIAGTRVVRGGMHQRPGH
jgi:pSer/pThr/pTyr-binding forkhead associated (FHA) protein/uncharacterized RDD family membrane protein YckC